MNIFLVNRAQCHLWYTIPPTLKIKKVVFFKICQNGVFVDFLKFSIFYNYVLEI